MATAPAVGDRKRARRKEPAAHREARRLFARHANGVVRPAKAAGHSGARLPFARGIVAAGRAMPFALAVAAASCMASCTVTRRIPEGSYMLKDNVVESDRATPKQERITVAELERHVLQRENRHFLGTNLALWLWAQANPERTSWWHRFLRGAGEETVVWDPALTERSVEDMEMYIASRGFFSGQASARVDTLPRRKVRVVYSARQGMPWRVGRIERTFRDTLLGTVIMTDSARTLLRTGDVFDTGVMDAERLRVSAYLRSRGYYDFNPGHITFVADSTDHGRTIDVEMVVRRNIEGYADDGTPMYADHRPYRLGRITVHSDHDPLSSGPPSGDTLHAAGLDIIHNGREVVWARLLRRAIGLRTDSLYSAADAAATSAELMRLGAYRSVSVMFDRVPGTDVLNCEIRCVPALRQSVGADVEGSTTLGGNATTTSFWALRTTLSYRNRNAFHGAELFEASVSSGFEFMRSGGRRLSYELSGEASLTFPRFVFWGAERSRIVRNPRSTLSVSAGWQDRAYYARTLAGLGWAYGWNTRRAGNFTLKPVDVSVVSMSYLSNEFKEQLGNPYLVASYDDQLIAGISGSYLFNDRPQRFGGGARVLRLGAETTGNLFSALVRLAGSRRVTGNLSVPEGEPPRTESYYNIFGIRFSQYVRGEGSFSQTFGLGEKSALAYRVHAGAIYSYGNSFSPPFDRMFFAGGAGSMRGWAVRTLGPGTVPYVRQRYPAQIGDVKFEANVEVRFPLMRSVGGAIFADAGNIWYMRSNPTEYPDEAVFRLGTFPRQLGLDGGLGLRFDVGIVLLRLDWGVQLHSPGRAAHERWIRRFRWADTALSFGIGHPF